jgi:hypothetical protein
MTPAEPVEPEAPRPGPVTGAVLPHEQRPLDHTPVHTADLPDTPQRDRTIPCTAWIEAPASLRKLGDDLGGGQPPSVPGFLRRIGPWLLWRAGPARGAHATYWAALADELDSRYTFHLFPDGTGKGLGPSGETHIRFRTWKEDLRDHTGG